MKNSAVVDLTRNLMNIHSPTGRTVELRNYMTNLFDKMGLPWHQTKKGAVYATLEGEHTEEHRVVTAHIDTLGAMVSEILDNGRLRISQIGGYAYNSIEAEHLYILTDEGVFTGTGLPDKASVHIHSDEVRETMRTQQTFQIRLDESVNSREDVLKLGICVGDYVAFETHFMHMESGFIKSRFLDNKLDVALMVEVIKDLMETGQKPYCTTHFLLSDYEEVGHGVYGLPKEVSEIIAIDIGTVGEGHTSCEKKVTIVAKDSRTPYDYELKKKLVQLAQKNNIDYAVDVHHRYGSDASLAMIQGFDMRFACFGPGVDATHHMERSHEKGVENTMKLLKAYLLSE